jgi:hypothetical protein
MNKVVQTSAEMTASMQRRECCVCSPEKSNPFFENVSSKKFLDFRLCMAASSQTQHKKRAVRTNRFRTKTILASHNLLSRCAAKMRATNPHPRPISFKKFGKF